MTEIEQILAAMLNNESIDVRRMDNPETETYSARVGITEMQLTIITDYKAVDPDMAESMFATRLRHGDFSTPSHAEINTDFLPLLRKIERQCAENNRTTVLYLAQQALGITQKSEPRLE